jgi:hypothetical protein
LADNEEFQSTKSRLLKDLRSYSELKERSKYPERFAAVFDIAQKSRLREKALRKLLLVVSYFKNHPN